MSVSDQLSAYTSLFIGLEYLLIYGNIIQFDPNVDEFLIFESVFLYRTATLPYVWIKSQKWTAFALGNTYLHQTFKECVSNQYTRFYILKCQMWLHVMERPLILLRFSVFSYLIYDYSCLKCFIFIKLSQIVCLVIKHNWASHPILCNCML